MTYDPDSPPLPDDARLGSWKERFLQKMTEHKARYDAGHIDWSACPAAERRPDEMSGAWCVRGTRIPIEGILINYRAGYGPEAFSRSIYMGLSAELAREILEYAGYTNDR
jgi:uncharacterized protein (DUF433 family)